MKARLLVAIFVMLTGALAANPQYLPHVVVGSGYVTTVTVTNLLPAESQWVFVHFYKEDGSRWTVPSNFGTFDRLDFNLAPLQTATAVISGQFTGIQSGWALADGGGPFAVSSAYQYSVDSAPAATAAVIPARSDTLSILPASLDTVAGVDTGVALVNPTDTAGDATLKLVDGQGQMIGTRTVNLPAKGKFTAFLSNPLLFPGIASLDGYVQVDSLTPVAAMGLRTEGALLTSLPAVHDVLPWSNSRTLFVNPLLGSDGFNDGSLAKPYKTIKKAQSAGDRGTTIYLLPGLYSAASGETFPIVLAYCMLIRGEDAAGVCILGGGTRPGYPVHCAFAGEYKGMIADVTVINPQGTGIYTTTSIVVDGCRVMHCGAAGIEIPRGRPILCNNRVFDNLVGIHVGSEADPDLGGGLTFSPGGNFIVGNTNCDLWVEAGGVFGARFNSWDTATPSRGTVCASGIDIAADATAVINW